MRLAEVWQSKANEQLTSNEKTIQQQMKRLLVSPEDKIVMTKMIDQSFRSHDEQRVSDQIEYILKKFGVPEFFSAKDKILMRLFLGIGKHFPHISIPRFIEKMRDDSSRSVIPGEKEVLKAHLEQRKRDGVTMNINYLGESVLGEEESKDRLEAYLVALKDPTIQYISIKISTIYSQISSLAFEHTAGILKERLAKIYRVARDNKFTRKNGAVVSKFVNLDMEEFRDLEITMAVFMQTLNDPEFQSLSAGIVLQAYIPDSSHLQIELTEWARKRVAGGGAPIKIRIVKGANMEMEQVESALNNWPLAPFGSKLDTDGNYKRMVDYGTRPENIKAVRLGIASHNLFELAYAYTVAKANGVLQDVSIEMLEGMADHVRRVIQSEADELVLYGPIATKESFISAIGYLLRRLDENTSEENFLRYSPDLQAGTREWEYLKKQFLQSCVEKEKPCRPTHRLQNRLQENHERTVDGNRFTNESDTDWSLRNNRTWANGILEKWKPKNNKAPLHIPLVVAGRDIYDQREVSDGFDPSTLPEKNKVYDYARANERDLQQALLTARRDPDQWRKKSARSRREILIQVAAELRRARGDLIGACAAGTGKVFTEADPEVSEAIDFAIYYSMVACEIGDDPAIKASGRGVGLVVSPWNFPVAIPCGGIAAALAAGNTVMFKPASSAILPAWELCQCFWRAGVSRNTLQFIPCSGTLAGEHLIGSTDVDFVILTGGTDTGLKMLETQPGLFLAAETGGKNATIVTAMSDRDQAVKNVIHSAFSNAGQKCSATSLLILEKEVFADEAFKKQLIDAAKSVKVGSVWELQNKIGPLIQAPQGDLKKALTELEPGESWLVKPECLHDNPLLWSPGIKWNVMPGSVAHLTEFFGPVLSVLCSDNLDHAIHLANQPVYGLTSGLESLDTREQELWKKKIQAGNLYINRSTTGAMVLRQPFGGIKKSSIGTGYKAGGPTYVMQFMNMVDIDTHPTTWPIADKHRILYLANEWEQLHHGDSGMCLKRIC